MRNISRDISLDICKYALTLSILCGYTPEGAFDYIEEGIRPKHKFASQNHVIDMVIMKIREGKTYAEIGEVYNIDKPDNIYGKIRRMRDKRDTKDMVAMREVGLYYYEIAEFYDLSKQAVHYRITNYEKEVQH